MNADDMRPASNWQPLTFSGEMIGAKAESGEALWGWRI